VNSGQVGSVEAKDVAVLARVAGLLVEEARLEGLAVLLAAALDAERAMDAAGARVELADALMYDAGWPEEGSGS
jgi:hypothetical protein